MLRFVPSLGLLLVATLGCAWLGGARRDAVAPGAPLPATLEQMTWRGDYLDVELTTSGYPFRFLFPASPECFEVFESDAPLTFTAGDPLGRVDAAPGSCDAIGVLSLREWIDHGPSRIDEHPAEPVEIEFQVTAQDGDIFLAIGYFELARKVGWADVESATLVMPNRGPCRLLNVFASGTMELHPGAQDPLVIRNRDVTCPVLGFTRRYAREVPPRDDAS